MPTGSPGVVGAAGESGEIVQEEQAAEQKASSSGGASAAGQPGVTGQGAQFVFAAATVANILCDNLTQTQINLLANFLSVVTTCVYAILTVENPNDLLES